MKDISKILFALIFISACNQKPSIDSTSNANYLDTYTTIDSPAVKVDTSLVKVDTLSYEEMNKMQDAQFHKPTVDEIADTRFRHNSPLRVDKRPLTQAEIEEDEFYEEYIRLRDIKRKERARKRAQKLLNSDSQ